MSDDEFDAPAYTPPPSRGGGRWLWWLIFVIAVFVGGGVFYHYASTNVARFFISVRDGQVIVRQGIFFPTGQSDFDGGAAYAPVPLPDGFEAPEARAVAGLAEVDRVLYGLFTGLTKHAVEAADPGLIEEARKHLERARLLPNISGDEADDILRYKGDIALAEGRLALTAVHGLLEKAHERVSSASARGTILFSDPAGWQRWIDAKLEEFAEVQTSTSPPTSDCWPTDLPLKLDAPRPVPAIPPATTPNAGKPAPGATPTPGPPQLGPSAPMDPAAAQPAPTPPALNPAPAPVPVPTPGLPVPAENPPSVDRPVSPISPLLRPSSPADAVETP